MRAVLGDACGRAAQQVARYDDIGICAADAERALLRNLAWAHVAVLAADARQTERALRLLLVEAVKDRVAAELAEILIISRTAGSGVCSRTSSFEANVLRYAAMAVM